MMFPDFVTLTIALSGIGEGNSEYDLLIVTHPFEIVNFGEIFSYNQVNIYINI